MDTQFTPSEKKRLQDLSHALPSPIVLPLVLTGHREDDAFSRMGDSLKENCPGLKIEPHPEEKGLPGFGLAKNIRFCAFPMERELPPFIDALKTLKTPAESGGGIPDSGVLDAVQLPVSLKLYIALACPHCPGMVNTVLPLAASNPNIHLEIIDGSLFQEAAQEDQIKAAPTLILDDHFRWTGMTTQEEIISMMADRDVSLLGAATLQTILEQGDAEWIAEQMVQSKKIFDNFLALLLHDTWSVRLGAMVVVETLAEQSKELALQLCPLLISRFEAADHPRKGDILYALGECGNLETLEWISGILPELEDPELTEAAREAIESLVDR